MQTEKEASPRKLTWWQKQQKDKAEQAILAQVKEAGGIISRAELKGPTSIISRLLREGKIQKLPCHLSRGPGSFKRHTLSDIFQDEAKAMHSGSYICLTRSDKVRIAMKILKKPKDKGTWKILSHYLRRYFNEAERLAVMWHLGYPMQQIPPENMKNIIKSQAISLNGFYHGKRAGRFQHE